MKTTQRIGVLLVTVVVVLIITRLVAGDQPSSADTTPQSPDLAPALLEGNAPIAPNKTEALIEQLKARVAAYPDDQMAVTQLGVGYLQRARETGDPTFYNLAEEALDKALELDPNAVDAMVARGSLMLSRHEFSEALTQGEKILSIEKRKASVYGLISDAQMELGMYDQAVTTIQKMVDIRPDLASYARVSYAREIFGDTEGAIIAMQQAVEAGGPAAENTNWSRVQLGNLYFNVGNLEKAEESYNFALVSAPGYLHAQAGLGKVAAARSQWQKAVDYYVEATKVVPVPEYVAALGDLYTKMGDAGEAKKQYDLFDFIVHTYEVNGVLFGIEGAMFYADHGMKLEEALAQAEKEGVSRKDIHTHDTLAWVLYKMGRYDAAWDHAQQATRLGTKEPRILFHAGMIAAKVGQPEKAKAFLEEVLSLNPRFHVLQADEAAEQLAVLK